MENQPFVVTEYHPDPVDAPSQVLQSAVTAWLKKELQN